MRISDWSSDVCSSDLLVPKIGTTAARLTSAALQAQSERRKTPPIGGRLRAGAESYAKLAQIAGARSYLLLPSTVAPERRRLRSIRRRLRILTVSGRSEERRVGHACVSTGQSRWPPHHSKNKTPNH